MYSHRPPPPPPPAPTHTAALTKQCKDDPNQPHEEVNFTQSLPLQVVLEVSIQLRVLERAGERERGREGGRERERGTVLKQALQVGTHHCSSSLHLIDIHNREVECSIDLAQLATREKTTTRRSRPAKIEHLVHTHPTHLKSDV